MNDEELHAWQTRVESDVQDLALTIQELQAEFVSLSPPEAPGRGSSFLDADLGVLDAWVTGWLLPNFRRFITPSWRWCPRWWDEPHGEAVIRLEALRRSWAVSQADPSGVAVLRWLTSLDATLAALSDASGTFASCSETECRAAAPFATEPVRNLSESCQEV